MTPPNGAADPHPDVTARPAIATGRLDTRRARLALLGSTAALLVALIVAPRHGIASTLLVVASAATGSGFALLEGRRQLLGLRPVVLAVGVVLFMAVAFWPQSSNDVWSYTMYGRMVSAHGVSPYQHVPADFPSDPFDHLVSPIWQHRGSVYGPAFVGYAATLTAVAGESRLADRLLFQLGAALAVAAALALVWRRTRSPAAVAWLGLNPVFGAIIVNSGQIDALIGLAILVAALLAAERRGWASGVALGVATLLKVTSLLALPALMFWAWRRGEQRLARQITAATLATTAIVYLPFVTGQSHVLAGADHSVTPGSPWNLPAQLLVGKDAGRDLPGLLPSNHTLSVLFYLSLALVGVLAVVLAWRWSSADRPELGVGAATASYAMAAEYTLPWYAGWALPVLADDRPTRLAWVIWWQSVVLLAAWKLPTHHTGSVADTILRGTFAYALPLVLLVAYVAVGDRRRVPAPAPAPAAASL
ncbi:MAG TPA: glycosyltransferase 87 family protein [Acidimicrobiia bacterium]